MPKSTEIRAVGEFAASRHGAFNLSQAAEHNLSRQDIRAMQRAGLVAPMYKHVWRFTSSPETARQQLYGATIAVHSVASHFSAAELERVDGFPDPPEQPEILVHHKSGLQVKGVVVQLVRVVDDIQRRGTSMQWVMYRATKLNHTGRPGPPLVLDVVRRRLGGYRVPESVFERMLAECLKSPLLSGIVRQHRLVDGDGDFICRFDFAVPWAKLGIEAHSRSYHLGEFAERYDEDRQGLQLHLLR